MGVLYSLFNVETLPESSPSSIHTASAACSLVSPVAEFVIEFDAVEFDDELGVEDERDDKGVDGGVIEVLFCCEQSD